MQNSGTALLLTKKQLFIDENRKNELENTY